MYLSTLGSHSVCAVKTPLGVDWKILSILRENPEWFSLHQQYIMRIVRMVSSRALAA